MNTTLKKLGLMASIYAMVSMTQGMTEVPYRKPEPAPEWKRKKCKSCSHFPCRPYLKPLHEACEKYNKRKG